MTRQTSIDAYQEILSNGLLSDRRFEIYKILYKTGPMTANEISEYMRGRNYAKGSNAHARLCELRELGVVKEVAEVKCSITGMTVIQWDVTDSLPKKLEKKAESSLWIFFPKMREEKILWFKTKVEAQKEKQNSSGEIYEIFKGF